jgi:hypothetical protein
MRRHRIALLCTVAIAVVPRADAQESTARADGLRIAVTQRSRYEALDDQFRPGLSGSDHVLALQTSVTFDARFPRVRLFGELMDSRGGGQWNYEVESIVQHGESTGTAAGVTGTDLDHEPYLQHFEIGYMFDNQWSPNVMLQYDLASGDRDPFRLAEAHDTWIGVGLRDTSAPTGKSVGRQLEASFTWTAIPDRLAVETGFAHLSLGRFPEQLLGARLRGDPRYFYATITTSV